MRLWLFDLTTRERRTMIGCFGGWVLDALDVQVYSFIIPTLLATWRISKGEAGLLGTVALLASALGGWAAGALADRLGRVRVLQIAILWYAGFTFLSGFSWNFGALFFCRAGQGIGFGGEWAAGAVLMGEVIRDRYRGRAVGLVQSGWAVGWAAAAILYTLAFATLPEGLAWRVLFWIGLAPAGLVFWLRRYVPEPDLYRAQAPRRETMAQFFAVLRPPYLARTLKISLMVMGAQASNYSVSTWLPTYLKTVRGLSAVNTGGYLLLHILGAFLGFVLGAYCADALGRKPTFAISALGSAVMIPLYLFLPLDDHMILLLGLPLGVVLYMMFSAMGPFMTEMYPTAVRGVGQGFCYSAGRAAGALFPAMIGFLADRLGLGPAIALFGFAACALMLAALAMLPETAGRALDNAPLPEPADAAPNHAD